MIQKYSALIMLIAFFNGNGMESVSSPCYLASLPVDVQNHIAHYLIFNDRESDEEFIDRSRGANAIAPEHKDLLNKKEKEKLSSEQIEYNSELEALGFYLPSLSSGLRTYSIDCSKIVTLDLQNPKVTVFDILTNSLHEHKKFQLSESRSQNKDITVLQIGLSRTGQEYAELIEEKKVASNLNGRGEVMRYETSTHLVIKNIFSAEIKKYTIPAFYHRFSSLGFNKQGTKIIVHAQCCLNENGAQRKELPETWFYIIPLALEEEHKSKSIKTLAAYLLNMCCCKSLKK